MAIKALIGFLYQASVEALLTSTGLVPRHEQNRLAPRVKRKSDSPFTVCRTESQFLHVWVAGTAERVNEGPSQLWPELLKN